MPPTYTDEGLRAAHQIRSNEPEIGVLVLSQYVETTYALELFAGGAGGLGYLLKDRVADVREFTDAVRRVAAGGSVIDPEVVASLVGRARESSPLDTLTDREREVLTLMAEGRSNQAISERMYLNTENGGGSRSKHFHQARPVTRPRRSPKGACRPRLPPHLTHQPANRPNRSRRRVPPRA